MPYSPEDLLFAETYPQKQQEGALDMFMSQMGRQGWPSLYKMNELESDPAYEQSVKSWLTNLERSNRMQYLPGVLDQLLLAKHGGPLGMHMMLQNMLTNANALGVDPTMQDFNVYTGDY